MAAKKGQTKAAPRASAERERFMQLAIAEAEKGIGRTYPNPPVGAVIVKNGRVVGKGYHRRAGQPHAEVEALEAAGKRAEGADLYVTLEPCTHHGRTPPCVEAVVAAGIKRVFVGAIDPNPLVQGKGLEFLREHRIQVKAGIELEACDALIRAFEISVGLGRPLVVLKAAVSLDGKLATSTGDSKWVSGEEARSLVHLWRDELDAVLVGAGTVNADDPLLTTRLWRPGVEGREPRTAIRIVLDAKLSARPTSKIFDGRDGPVWVCTSVVEGPAVDALKRRGVEIVPFELDASGRIPIPVLLVELARRGLTSVLVEGGADVFRDFLSSGHVDELRLFVAPRIVGGDGLSWTGPLGITAMKDSLRLEGMQVGQVGEDMLVVGRPVRPEPEEIQS